MTYLPGGPVIRNRPAYIEERVADLEFQTRRLEGRLRDVEAQLQEALDAIAILRQPRDVRYVQGLLRGRS